MRTAPWDAIEAWTPPSGAIPTDEMPFWDITPWARQAFELARDRGEQPEHAFILFGLEDCPICERLEADLNTLGEKRFGRRTLLRLKALCGRKAHESTTILRSGQH